MVSSDTLFFRELLLKRHIDVEAGAAGAEGLMQLGVSGRVEKRKYLESAVQMNGIFSDLLL